MKPGAHIVLRSASRFYAPLIFLFAFSLLATRPAGEGVGFIAGMIGALALALHLLVFGAAAAREALPPAMARVLLSLGLIAVLASAGGLEVPWRAQLLEAGLFLLTAAGASLLLTVFVGRAPTLRDEDW